MTKDLRNTVVWMVFATMVLGITFWQAQVTIAKETAARHQVQPPPSKTRHSVRPPAQPFTGDPVADYIARCEKGMTDQEIGWIIEDFQNAGLDFDWENPAATDAQVFAARDAQQRWYRDALVDGLRLSPAQSEEATRKLGELFQIITADFLRDRESVKADGFNPVSNDNHALRFTESWLVGFSSYPTATPFFPWKLCQLTPRQEHITWKQWFEDLKKISESTGGPLFLFSGPYEDDLKEHRLPGWVISPNSIFPLLDTQKLLTHDPFAEPATDVTGFSDLENVRLLHPSQFKLVLMFNPDMARKIRQAMEREVK